MDSLATLTTFLGWCTVINVVILCVSFVATVLFNAPVKKLHTTLMDVDASKLDEIYLSFLAYYKLAIFIFNLVPYLALKIMA